ncbi:MAG: TVP38/TMEM64 family protein [Verrucomicrobia bacterium]|nr:TVP38/TMEM64 family protein [Verrucomicrobiota bacterium]
MPATSQKSPSRGKIAAVIGFILLIIAAFVLGDPKAWLNTAITEVEKLGPWGPVVFIVCYIIATVLMVPGSALTLAAGTLFGVVYGTGIASIAATSGAAAAFLVGRFLARDAVAAKIARNASFAALDRAMGDEGWKIVALARLSPIFPFTLLNYAFGLTKVKFLHYVLASWVAMLPGTLLYVYLGSLARSGVKGGAKTPLEWTMYGVGFVATLAVTIFITKLARKAIDRAGLAPAKDKKP